jgi:hypothetical protein
LSAYLFNWAAPQYFDGDIFGYLTPTANRRENGQILHFHGISRNVKEQPEFLN